MKTYKTETKEVTTQKVISAICDFCDKEIEARSTSAEENEVREVFNLDDYGSGYLTTDVKLYYSQGYPEGTDTYEYSLDICPTCFKKEILDRAKRFEKKESDF